MSIVRPDPAIRYSMFSEEFAKLIDAPVQDLGDHPMKGIDGLQKVFGLAEV